MYGQIYTTLLLTNLASIALTSEELLGKTSKKCIYFNNSADVEYQCPPDKDFNRTVIHIKPLKLSIDVDCNDIEELTRDFLPDVNFEDATRVNINSCPIPKTGFRDLTNNFNVTNLVILKFTFKSDPSDTLTKESFAELPYLKQLELSSNRLKHIDENIFATFPGLVRLFLDRNSLELTPNLFRNNTKLEFLSISSNGLKSLPDKIFDNLKSLKILHLWKNKIDHIDESNFIGLSNLQSLELSFNFIQNISDDSFIKLTNLDRLNLRNNSISSISRNVFRRNELLQDINLDSNYDLHLTDGVFSNFPKLKKINLGSSRLKSLPENLFENSTNLERIMLHSNKLKKLPNNLFQHLTKLKVLHLNHNQLEELYEGIFRSSISLETLHLHHNQLTVLTRNLLKGLVNLKEINLSNNEIFNIDSEALIDNGHLQTFLMGGNKYTFNVSPFTKCASLIELNLSDNLMVEFPDGLKHLKSLRRINLRRNRITTLQMKSLLEISQKDLIIDLEHNNISLVNFLHVEEDAMRLIGKQDSKLPVTKILLSNNPIRCDCKALDLLRYIKDRMSRVVKSLIQIHHENLICVTADNSTEARVQNMDMDKLTCPILKCSANDTCHCLWRPSDKSIVVNCTHRNISLSPNILPPTDLDFSQTELHLSGNSLKRGPEEYEFRLLNVTKLYLQDNRIKHITWLPSDISVLELHNNKIEYLNYDILQKLENPSLRRLTLNNNEWKCNCSITNFTNYLKRHSYLINAYGIRCNDSNQLVINLNEKHICQNDFELTMEYIIGFAVFLLAIGLCYALYYKYQLELKIYLYARGCYCSTTEEDEDKPYDVFLSFSENDKEFINDDLIAILEHGPRPYKLCLPDRDWMPGDLITSQIATSVLRSKRSLVVLSPNFLDSPWVKMVFRTAHTQAMSEKRAGVIVILYGDVDVDSLDEDLKAYLKTNTYIKWGDPWFWYKLNYALPHTRRQEPKNAQQHANMMYCIDDKFDLIKQAPTLDPKSTPPITLDLEMLKQHPLDFQSVNLPTK